MTYFLNGPLFEGELYGIPPYFPVNCSDQIYQETSFIRQMLPSRKTYSGDEIDSIALLVEASPLFYKLAFPNFHDFLLSIFNNIKEVASTFSRVDIVFDRYFSYK